MAISTIDVPIEVTATAWLELPLDKDKFLIQNLGSEFLLWRVEEDAGQPPLAAAVFTVRPGGDILVTEKLTGFIKLRAKAGTTTIVYGDYVGSA